MCEKVYCGESDTMIKISGKMDKSNIYKGLILLIFHSFSPRSQFCIMMEVFRKKRDKLCIQHYNCQFFWHQNF